jgi:imidazolonepropionase-like amidohydrolase
MAIVFRNGRVITGTGEVIERGLVVVDGPVIVFVGPGKTWRISKKDFVFDLSGKAILPGLIDCHVHLCMDGSSDSMTSLMKEPIALNSLKAARHARLTLEAGVTTVRDMGGRDYVDISLRNAIREKVVQGPRMLCSGKMICMTGGYGWQYSQEADGPEGVRKAVKEQIKAGADVIKMMATGGVLARGLDSGAAQLTLEELTAGVEEARKAGKRTATHCQGKEGIRNSLLAGITSIEHGIFLDDETAALLAERKAFLVPTLSPPHRILRGGVNARISSFVVARARSAMKDHLESIVKAHKAKLPIAMGTDAGTPFNHHGENLGELELLLTAGMSPMEAILSATKTASEVLGLEKEIGTLEKGKLADLIVVDGDPLEEIRLLQEKEKVAAVMMEGQFFKCVL